MEHKVLIVRIILAGVVLVLLGLWVAWRKRNGSAEQVGERQQ